MNCEICHKAPAAAAITREKNGVEEELYVCAACAKAEKQRRQRKSQTTRRIIEVSGDGEGEEPPPLIGALINAFDEIANDLEKCAKDMKERREAKESQERRVEFPAERVPAAFRIGHNLHLEGLFIIGELDSVKRALRALHMDLIGVSADGLSEAGHVYRLSYATSSECAKRVVADILHAEESARIRLVREMPRVLSDAFCRALAVLKNCRLLSPAEQFDILATLRLAALLKFLDGITRREIESMIAHIRLDSFEDKMTPDECDAADAERADEMNERFQEVLINDIH